MNMNYFSFYNKAKELLIDSLASLWFKGQAQEQDDALSDFQPT